MKRVRALLAALVTACGLLLGAAEILAANQGKLESVQGNTTVREGQEVALRFSLEEIPGISGEINALKGTLEADSAIFEAVFETVSSIFSDIGAFISDIFDDDSRR